MTHYQNVMKLSTVLCWQSLKYEYRLEIYRQNR